MGGVEVDIVSLWHCFACTAWEEVMFTQRDVATFRALCVDSDKSIDIAQKEYVAHLHHRPPIC
jgi:hypothetical protein